MRADNHGEGGILALLALVHPRRAKHTAQRAALLVVGLVGATLLYGDGTITPAISVLSAIEGLKLYAPQMSHAVVPLTVVILAALFMIQRNGTSFVGGLFGPVMLVWFLVAGALGAAGIVREPAVLAALSPIPAVTYLLSVGPLALVVIGGAFLAVTGGEAFYADMGHFGPLPIRLAWFGLALPALTLSYFGQGALLLAEPGSPEVLDNPFYALAPQWAHYPLVALATVATVIASQADHIRRLFPDGAGDQPRLPAADDRDPHRGARNRPDLHPVRQLGARGRDARGGARVRLVGRARGRLRRGRVAPHGDHHGDGDLRGPALEDQPADRLRCQREPARARPSVLRCDLDQAPRRRRGSRS